jgi:hypothetical protein
VTAFFSLASSAELCARFAKLRENSANLGRTEEAAQASTQAFTGPQGATQKGTQP